MTDDNMKSNKVCHLVNIVLLVRMKYYVLQFTEDIDYRAVEDDFM